MKFYNKLPTEDGLYWVLYKEFDSQSFRVKHPSPYFQFYTDVVQIVVRETKRNKTCYYCQKTYCPIEPDMFYFGDQINKPETIEIMEKMDF